MNDQLNIDVKTIVDEIFKKKEDADMRKETELALTKSAETITQLNESLEAKDEEHATEINTLKDQISALESKVAELEESATSLEEEKASFDIEKEELTKRAESAEEELENIRKDQLAQARMSDLTDSGVASTNEEAQITKVRDMSEEDFAAYKEELVSVRESILTQLQSSEEEAAAEETTEEVVEETAEEEVAEEGAEEEVVEEETAEEDAETETEEEEVASEEEAASAQEAIDRAMVATAALNMEVTPSEDMRSKYNALGAAMAKSIKERR